VAVEKFRPVALAANAAATIILMNVAAFTVLVPEAAGAQQTRAPSLRNAENLHQRVFDAYTLEMRRHGLIGSPTLSLTVRANGRATNPQIVESSGIDVLDRAALELARHMRFDPARNSGEEVDASVRLPIEFRSDCGLRPPSRYEPDMLDLLGELDAEAIDHHYVSRPAAVLLDVMIDSGGRPSDIRILESSGLADSDTLAMRRVAATRYEPVQWEGTAVSARFRQVVLPKVDVPPSGHQACPNPSAPKLTNRDFLLRATRMVAEGAADTGRPLAREAMALLWVRADDGKVGRVYITEGSCWTDLDDYLLSVWMAATFEPASCDGEPISMYVFLPVKISG
jgi:TonB family protein